MAKTTEPNHREWVPSMLRKSRALSLASLSLLLAAILEILDILVSKNQGIPTPNAYAILPIRYLPTAATIALAFMWKALAGDVKMVLPWSVMSTSEKWTDPADTLSLNYINGIEVVSVVKACKRKHWAMFLVLIMSLFAGLSVALANILTYTNPAAITTTTHELVKTSTFSLENAFVSREGEITMPLGHLGSQPYTAVTVERLYGGKATAWTKDGYSFESFRYPSNPTPDSSVIEATVSSVWAGLNCDKLGYPPYPNDTLMRYYFEANATDLSSRGCQSPTLQLVGDVGISLALHTLGWTNVTTCSEDSDDKLFLATIAKSTRVDEDGFPTLFKATGLMCSPVLTVQNTSVRANASSGDIIDYRVLSKPVPINHLMSTEAIWIYLNNPTSLPFQQGLSSSSISADMETVVNVSRQSAAGQTAFDSFFDILTDGQLEETVDIYFDNAELFKSDVEELGKEILSQVINMLGKKNESQPISGWCTTQESRLFIQPIALRALQGLLLLACVTAVSLCSFVRPRSHLRESPASMAAAAVILATSNPRTESFFAQHSTTSDACIREALCQQQCRFTSDSRPQIEMHYDATMPRESMTDHHEKGTNLGWQPLAFRKWAKWCTILVIAIGIAALAILQSFSDRYSGLSSSDSTTQATFGYITSISLLLLSYICSGIDGCIKSLNSYSSLRSSPRRRPLLLGWKESPTFWVPFRATGIKSGLAIIVSSITVLLFPFIKIVSAGLFANVQILTTQTNVTMDMDTSLLDHLEDDFILDSTISVIQAQDHASKLTDWIVTSNSDIGQSFGIVDNIVLSNFTGFANVSSYESMMGYELRARVPAIAVDVQCTSIAEDGFTVTKREDDRCETPMFDIQCTAAECRNMTLLNEPSVLNNLTYLTLDGGDPTCVPQPYTGVCFFPSPATMGILLADFTAVQPQTTNDSGTDITVTVHPRVTKAPTLRMSLCRSNISLVEIDTSFTQQETPSSHALWTPSHVDHSSITYIKPYKTTSLFDSLAPWGGWGGRFFEKSIGGTLNSTTLWPTSGGSMNTFQLLAAFASASHPGNLTTTTLLDPAQLARTSEAVYTAYATQMLAQLRPAARALTNVSAPSLQHVAGIVLADYARVAQDRRTTAVLEALLALVLASVLLSFWRFGGRDAAVLPKEPDSIAARFALLAGSRLVQRLRAEGVERVADSDDVWEEVARLGWWRVESEDDSSGTGGGEGKMWRWGIDVGEDVRLAGWNEPPEDDMSKAPGVAQDGQGVAEGDAAGQRRVDSLPVLQSLLQSEEDLSSEGQPDGMTRSESDTLMRRGTW